MIVNTSFIPFNTSITTDDVQQAGAWMVSMMLVVLIFTICTFNEHGRTFINMFFRNEHRNRFTGELKDHKLLTGKFGGTWFVTWINLVLSLFFVVTMTIVTWYFYGQKSNWNLVEGTDWFALTATVATSLWLVVLICLGLADVWNKMWLGYRVATTTASERDLQVATLLTSIDGRPMVGIQGYTSVNIRWGIWFINTVVWGLLPFILTMFAISWDRSPNVSYFDAIPNIEAGFVGTTGILLTITWLIHSFKVYYAYTYYTDDGYELKYSPDQLTPSELNLIQIGLTADTFGIDRPFKGRFPFQYCPEHFMLARSIFAWALGWCMYNDRLKAFALYLNVGILPLALTYFAGDNVYYITFEGMCWYFFFIFSYFIQGSFYYQSIQSDINMNLITVRPSAEYPGMDPWDNWQISISLIFGLAFSLTVISFFKTASLQTLSGSETRSIVRERHPMDHRYE